MDSRLEELKAKFEKVVAGLGQPNYWINSHVAKGPISIIWRTRRWAPGKRLWIVADEKIPGYSFEKIIGSYILTGGNLRQFPNEIIPSSPLELYQMQIEEELGSKWKLGSSFRPTITLFADYLEEYSVEEHGNEAMRKASPVTNGDVYAIVSLIGSTIEGERLQEELKIPSRRLTPAYLRKELLKRISSTEAGLVVLAADVLSAGAIENFAAGDGLKLADYLGAVHGIGNLTVTDPKGRATRLYQTTPLTPYSQRETMQYSRVNPFRSKTDPPSPFKKV